MTPVDTHIHSNQSPFRRPGADTSSPSASAEGVRLAEQDAQDNVDGRRLKVVTAASIKPKRVRWLWAPGDEGYGRIPMGELTLVVGRGGVGKSTLLCEWAAWITRGVMRGEFYGVPRDVIYVVNEDSLEYTVVPRLIAAGADLSRVHFVGIHTEDMDGDGKVLLPLDNKRIGELARTKGAVALLLDPLASNLALDNTNNQKQVRTAVESIRVMCERYEFAAIGLAHTRKAASANLMDALMGSAELGNVCRSAMGVVIDPDEEDDRVVILSQEKSNLGRTDLDSFKYKISNYTTEYEGDIIGAGRLEWVGKTETKASDVLSDQMNNITSVGECMKWLIEFLSSEGGEAPRADVFAKGRKESYSESTLKRAAKKARLLSVRSGYPATAVWRLPPASSSS